MNKAMNEANIKQGYIDFIQEAYASYCDYHDFRAYIMGSATQIATTDSYTDAERGKRLRLFFQALKEVSD